MSAVRPIRRVVTGHNDVKLPGVELYNNTSGNMFITGATANTGWTAGTGTANKAAFAAYAGATHTGAYVQATIQALDDAAKNASQRLKAIEDALRNYGIIF